MLSLGRRVGDTPATKSGLCDPEPPKTAAQEERESRREFMASARRKLKAKGLSDMEIAEALMELDIRATNSLSVFLDQDSHEKLATFTNKIKHREHIVWVMMDSGAGNHVRAPEKHVAEYTLHTDKPSNKFVTATGQVVPNKGEKHTRIRTSEGSICNVTFQCADVDMPVLSTRKLCESGHEVLYKHNGGLTIDTKTGQTTKFVMRAGVYYLKLRVLKPAGHERSAGLARQA